MDKDGAINEVTVCPGCDIILATQPIHVPLDSYLLCPRCRLKVRNPRKESVSRTLALSLTGLLLFIPAHFMFLLQLKALGLFDQGTVIDSITALYGQKYFLVALIVLLTAVIIPFVKLFLLCTVSLGLAKGIFRSLLPRLFRWYCHLEEWGMTEVYLIGILIAIVKMRHTADIMYEAGFFSFAGLTLALVGCLYSLDKHHYWNLIEKGMKKKVATDTSPRRTAADLAPMHSALLSGLVQCHTCHKVLPRKEQERTDAQRCPRCGGIVHKRIPNSVSTTWALVLTAFFFLFPANMLPIMQVDFLGSPEKSTIMEGIKYFFQTDSYGIGIVILTASVLVPVFKIVGMVLLLYSVHFRRGTALSQKSVMFRFIEFIGRWSMLDIFVIALLCALVDFGFFTRITVAPAAPFFAFVVLATMFAAISFDPRMLWDIAGPHSGENKE